MWVKEVSRDEFLLGNLAVRSRYRGKGAGSIMLDHVEEVAKKAGYAKVALRVAIENQAARKLYERMDIKPNPSIWNPTPVSGLWARDIEEW